MRRKSDLPTKMCAVCGSETALSDCTRCKGARYCSKDCQRIDWKTGGHREMCAELGELLARQPKQRDGAREADEGSLDQSQNISASDALAQGTFFLEQKDYKNARIWLTIAGEQG